MILLYHLPSAMDGDTL